MNVLDAAMDIRCRSTPFMASRAAISARLDAPPSTVANVRPIEHSTRKLPCRAQPLRKPCARKPLGAASASTRSGVNAIRRIKGANNA